VLGQEEQQQFQNIFQPIKTTKLPNTLNNTTALILDGADWYLEIDYQGIKISYHWRAASQDIRIFENLIDFILARFDLNQYR